LWFNDGSCVRLRPARANHVWSYNFVSAKTYDGRTVRMLNLIDEDSRECLMIRLKRRWNSAKVIEALADVMVVAEERHLAEIREHLNEKLSQTYNEMAEAPVNLPHRQALLELISAATDLNSEMGTSRTRALAAQMKAAEAAAEIQKTTR
jgi:hypothetical protein